MRTSPRTLFLAGSATSIAIVAAACVSNNNSPLDIGDLDASFLDGGGTTPSDGSPSSTDATKPGSDGSPPGTDGASPGTDGSSPGTDGSPPGADGAVSGDAGTLLDGSADGGVSFGTLLAPPLYAAASDDGSAMIVSAVSGPPGGSPIYFSHFEPGQGWTAPAPVPGAAASWTLTSEPPRLAMDGSGNAFLVWATELEDAGFDWAPVVARYDHATNTWGALVLPDPYTGKTPGFYTLGVSPSGTAIVETVHTAATGPAVYALRYSAGTWTPELAFTDVAGAADAPGTVQILDNGRALLLWTGNGGPGVAARDPAGVWTAGTSLSFVTDSTAITAAIDNAGDIVVPYANGNLGAYEYNAADAGWSATPTSIAPSSTGSLSAAMNATTGDAVVTDSYTLDGGAVLESFAYTGAPKTWGAAQPVPIAVAVGLESVVYDSSGNGVALWGSSTPTNSVAAPTQIFASTYTIAGGWTPASPALSDTFSATNQSLVAMVSPNGQHAFAAWTESGAGTAVQLK